MCVCVCVREIEGERDDVMMTTMKHAVNFKMFLAPYSITRTV